MSKEQQLQPLWPVDFAEPFVKTEDIRKASNYGNALEGSYQGGRVESVSSSILMMALCSLISSLIFCLGLGVPFLLMFAFCGPCSFVTSMVFLETFRKRGSRRVLADPEARYFYRLKQAVESYNAEVVCFNKHLTALEVGAGQLSAEKLAQFRDTLEDEYKSLKKRIIVGLGESVPPIDLPNLWRRMRELREAEGQLALPASERLALPAASSLAPQPEPAAPSEPSEYMKALAELNAEFPDSPEETE